MIYVDKRVCIGCPNNVVGALCNCSEPYVSIQCGWEWEPDNKTIWTGGEA